MTDQQRIARNVRTELARQGRRQNEIAKAIGMSAIALYRRMNGKVPWKVSELQTLARELGVPLETLTGSEQA